MFYTDASDNRHLSYQTGQLDDSLLTRKDCEQLILCIFTTSPLSYYHSAIIIKHNSLLMSKKVPYAEETREEVCRANVNQSTAKVLWSFAKRQRFIQNRPVCPYSSYQYDLSTISKRKAGFGSSQRKVFTQTSEGASSWNYNPSKGKVSSPYPSFGLARDTCSASSYLSFSVYKNPGPGQYEGQAEQRKRGYSMRPKTATEKNYFIDNKQLKLVPSPFEYNVKTCRDGVATVSKFRTVTMGAATIQSKNQRFKNFTQVTPSPNLYQPIKFGINKYSKNGKIGFSARKSFIDEATKSEFTPGPGNYRVPSDFGHYSNFKRSRFSVA